MDSMDEDDEGPSVVAQREAEKSTADQSRNARLERLANAEWFFEVSDSNSQSFQVLTVVEPKALELPLPLFDDLGLVLWDVPEERVKAQYREVSLWLRERGRGLGADGRG